jgi:hypothetical protein
MPGLYGKRNYLLSQIGKLLFRRPKYVKRRPLISVLAAEIQIAGTEYLAAPLAA